MTEHDIIQAISINLLRISEWYYKNPIDNKVVCQRYLLQSQQLGKQITHPKVQEYVQQLNALSLKDSNLPHEKTAERFLTLGVLLQHPEKWAE